MGNKKTGYLCGGIFFDLLLRKKPEGESEREKLANVGKNRWDWKRLKNNQPDMLLDLIHMFYPEFVWPGDRASSESSGYRNCEKNKTIYLPFDKSGEIGAFDERVQSQYQMELKKMHDTVILRLNIKSEAEMLELIKQMLDYLERDTNVKDNEKFYAVRDGRGLTKKELLNESEYCLDALLLGIWHYILMHRFENKKGKATHDSWYKAVGDSGTKYDLIEPLGKDYPREVSYYLWNENDLPISEREECETNHIKEAQKEIEPEAVETVEPETREEEIEQTDTESVEAEVVDDIPSGEGKKKKKKKKKKAGRTINQYNVFSGNGPQYGHVDKIEINNYNK